MSVSAISLILGNESRKHIGTPLTTLMHRGTSRLNCAIGPLTHDLHAYHAQVLNFVDRRITAAPCTNNVVLNTRSTTDACKCVVVAIDASNETDRRGRVTALGQCNISNFFCSGVSGHVTDIPTSLNSCPIIVISTASTSGRVPDVRPSRFRVTCSTAGQLVRTSYGHVTCVKYSRGVVTRSNHFTKCRTTLRSSNFTCSPSLMYGILGGNPTLHTISGLFSRHGPSNFFYFGSTHT